MTVELASQIVVSPLSCSDCIRLSVRGKESGFYLRMVVQSGSVYPCRPGPRLRVKTKSHLVLQRPAVLERRLNVVELVGGSCAIRRLCGLNTARSPVNQVLDQTTVLLRVEHSGLCLELDGCILPRIWNNALQSPLNRLHKQESNS